jgi:hypothetical protein
LEILGVSWPPVKGWRERTKTWISEEESYRLRRLGKKLNSKDGSDDEDDTPREVVPPLGVAEWVKAWKENAERIEELEAEMSSGAVRWNYIAWVPRATALAECHAKERRLLSDLVRQLQFVPAIPADLFDRPHLAATLAAVHETFGGIRG